MAGQRSTAPLTSREDLIVRFSQPRLPRPMTGDRGWFCLIHCLCMITGRQCRAKRDGGSGVRRRSIQGMNVLERGTPDRSFRMIGPTQSVRGLRGAGPVLARSINWAGTTSNGSDVVPVSMRSSVFLPALVARRKGSCRIVVRPMSYA